MLCHSLRDYGGISSWRQFPTFTPCTISYPIWLGIQYQTYQLEDISFVYFRLGFIELRSSICIGYEVRCYVYVFETELMVILSRQKSLSGCYVYDGWIRKTPYPFHFVMCMVKRTHRIWDVCKVGSYGTHTPTHSYLLAEYTGRVSSLFTTSDISCILQRRCVVTTESWNAIFTGLKCSNSSLPCRSTRKFTKLVLCGRTHLDAVYFFSRPVLVHFLQGRCCTTVFREGFSDNFLCGSTKSTCETCFTPTYLVSTGPWS